MSENGGQIFAKRRKKLSSQRFQWKIKMRALCSKSYFSEKRQIPDFQKSVGFENGHF